MCVYVKVKLYTHQYPNPNRCQFVLSQQSYTKYMLTNVQQVKSITLTMLKSLQYIANIYPFFVIIGPIEVIVLILQDVYAIPICLSLEIFEMKIYFQNLLV